MSLLPKKPMAIKQEATFLRLLSGLQEQLGIRGPDVADTDLQGAQKPIEPLGTHPVKDRISKAAKREGARTIGGALTIGLDRSPRGPGRESTQAIQEVSEEIILREERPPETPTSDISPCPIRQSPQAERVRPTPSKGGNPSEKPRKRVFTTREAAKIIGIHRTTLYTWARQENFGHQARQQARWSFTEEDLERAQQIKQERREAQAKRLRALPKRVHYSQLVVEQLRESLRDQPGTFGLSKAATLLVKTGQRQKGERDLYETLRRWTYLTLAEAIEKNQPGLLSPTALAFRGKKGRSHYRLTIADIKTILSLSPRFYQKKGGLERAFRATRQWLLELQEANVNLNQVALDLLGRSSNEARKRIEAMLSEGLLSLGDYPLLFANTIGIPPDVYEKLKPVWQQELEAIQEKQREALCPRRKLQIGRIEGTVRPMGSLFQEIFGLERKSVYTKLAAFYLARRLEPFGIKVELVPHPHGASYYCFVGQEDAARLRKLSQERPEEARAILDNAERILREGFKTLQEYQEYCPPEFPIALSNSLRLLLGGVVDRQALSANIETVKGHLRDLGLRINKVKFGPDRKTGRKRTAYYLPLEALSRFGRVSQLQGLKEALWTLGVIKETPSPSTLYKRGELFPLSSLLEEAGYKKGLYGRYNRIRCVFEFLKDKMTIYQVSPYNTYQLPKKDRKQALQVINDHRQEIKRLLS